MRKLPHTAAEDLLEVIMRRYERASTLLTSNRPVDDWSKLLGDTAAVRPVSRSVSVKVIASKWVAGYFKRTA
jgi:DNA replication protein DnaC